jgi:hypothetical protein
MRGTLEGAASGCAPDSEIGNEVYGCEVELVGLSCLLAVGTGPG